MHDVYHQLTVHIMIGSSYREDPEFLSTVLFQNEDIKTWYFLRLAAFEFYTEVKEEFSQQQIVFPVDLPSGYKSVSL